MNRGIKLRKVFILGGTLLLMQTALAQNSHRVRSLGPLPLEAGQNLNILLPAPYDCFVLRVSGGSLPEFLLLDGDTLRADPHAP